MLLNEKESTIYMDHNATTPLHPEVLDAMMPFLEEYQGNPSSIHQAGRETRCAIEDARGIVADFIGAELDDEIIFTSGGTEADNLAIKGFEAANDNLHYIVTSKIEHPAVLRPYESIKRRLHNVIYLEVDWSGMINVSKLLFLKDTVSFCSLMHANNETGNIQPIHEAAKICEKCGIILHVDAVQSFGKIPLLVGDLGADMLSISGHKIYGPKGIGALYVRRGLKIAPLLQGGHQERDLRAGTENVPAIVGFGKAVQIAKRDMGQESERISSLRDNLMTGIAENIKDIIFNTDYSSCLPNTVNVSFLDVESDVALLMLDQHGIQASNGSACESGSIQPSHVLKAMGRSDEVARGAIRFSLGKENTQEHIDYLLEVLPGIISAIREDSQDARIRASNLSNR